MYVIDRGTPENVGKQSGPECGWCTKTGLSASNKWCIQWKCRPRSPSGGSLEECTATRSTGNWSNSFWMVTGRIIQNSYPDNWNFPVTPRLHQMIYWNSCDVLAVVKPHARHRYAVAAVQALPAQCAVPVRVAKVVSMKEQGKLFRQTTMTKMNRCISTEPRMGSKQPVWKLFNMVTMTTINLKLIHYCYWIYFSQFGMPDLACTSSLQFHHLLPAKHYLYC